MNQPKPFIVYWTSAFAGTNPGWTTAKFKSNLQSFHTVGKALDFHNKLSAMQLSGELYRGRKIYHVGKFEYA